MSAPTDFDFLFGAPWTVAHRRRAGDGTWATFSSTCRVTPLLDGSGHLDELDVPDLPGVGAVQAFTVRLFDPADDVWRIWWSASTRPGHLDPPMVGGFADGVGTFFGDDVLAAGDGGRLRFRWLPGADGGPRWEQARSAGEDAAWETDWTMDFTRGAA